MVAAFVDGRVSASGTLSSATAGPAVMLGRVGDYEVTISGTFVGTARVERQPPGDANWYPVTYVDGSALAWTAPASTPLSEPQAGTSVRVVCTAFTSGSIAWQVGQ